MEPGQASSYSSRIFREASDMAARSLSLKGNRKLTITSVEATADHSIQPPFVTFLPAYSAPERQQAEALMKELINLGCVEFCCVGPEAELLHDALDEIIVAEGACPFGRRA
jgi:hypothetical protein